MHELATFEVPNYDRLALFEVAYMAGLQHLRSHLWHTYIALLCLTCFCFDVKPN